jgi:hypothetical protein
MCLLLIILSSISSLSLSLKLTKENYPIDLIHLRTTGICLQNFRCSLSISSEARQKCVLVRSVVAMSPCRLAYKTVLRFEPSGNVTSRQHAARQRAIWRTSLATGRQDESLTTHRLARCPVFASANKSVPIQPSKI